MTILLTAACLLCCCCNFVRSNIFRSYRLTGCVLVNFPIHTIVRVQLHKLLMSLDLLNFLSAIRWICWFILCLLIVRLMMGIFSLNFLRKHFSLALASDSLVSGNCATALHLKLSTCNRLTYNRNQLYTSNEKPESKHRVVISSRRKFVYGKNHFYFYWCF